MSLFGRTRPEPDPVRERVERRLGPRFELLRRRAWLFAHILIFIAVMVFVYAVDSPDSSSIFHYTTTFTSPASSYIDPVSQIRVALPAYTYTLPHTYPLVILLSAIWGVFVLLHMLSIWAGFQRERVIQREMTNEMELEKMRLQLELARLTQDQPSNDNSEKPKRTLGLSDDGELLFDENSERQQAYHRRSRYG